jgi:transposase-like protein
MVRAYRFPQGRPRGCLLCSSSRVIRWGRFRQRQRYRCKDCRRTFSDLTGSPLAYTKYIHRWLAFGACMAEGLSVRRTARRVAMAPDTAFRWRHRLIEAYAGEIQPRRRGSVALTWLSLPVSEKGCKEGDFEPRRHRLRLSLAGHRYRSYVLFLRWGHTPAWTFEVDVLPRRFLPGARYLRLLLKDRIAPRSRIIYGGAGAEAVMALAVRLGTEVVRVDADWRWLRPGRRRFRWVPWVVLDETTALDESNDRRPDAPDRSMAQPKRLFGAGQELRLRWQEWMRRFRGIATQNLRRYIAWFRNLDFALGPVDWPWRGRGHPRIGDAGMIEGRGVALILGAVDPPIRPGMDQA